MWLFLLFHLLLQASIRCAFSDQSSFRRVHQANIAKLKCDSLPYRSLSDETTCSFAVNTPQVPFERGTALCNSALAGAVMDTSPSSRHVLALLFLNPSNYHSEFTVGQSKRVLCKYESSNICKDNELKEFPGKCLKRLNSTMSFTEAKQRCNSMENSRLITINNDDENKAFASTILQFGRAWIDQPRFDQKSDKLQFFRWFMGDQTRSWCSANRTANMFVTKKHQVGSSCSNFGYWQPVSITEPSYAFCARPTDGVFSPVQKEETTTTSTTTTTAITTTRGDQNIPASLMISVKFYRNAESVSHAFCATPACISSIQSNGIGYNVTDPTPTVMGKVVPDNATIVEAAKAYCPIGWANMRLLGFTLIGQAYHHNLNGQGLVMGYVSIADGTCGATEQIKKWKSRYHGDYVYGRDLKYNSWEINMIYKGMVQDGGKIQWYMWPREYK